MPDAIGNRTFTDGNVRAVYQDAAGQFVIDDDGERVYGTWILKPDPTSQTLESDEPTIVPGE
jgi:hypothetical protein